MEPHALLIAVGAGLLHNMIVCTKKSFN